MPHGNAQLKQSRIDNGFLIEQSMSYKEIAEYFIKNDPVGIEEIIYYWKESGVIK